MLDSFASFSTDMYVKVTSELYFQIETFVKV